MRDLENFDVGTPSANIAARVRPGICHIFDSKSSTTLQTENNAWDNRIGAEGGSIVATGDSSITVIDGGALKVADDALWVTGAVANHATENVAAVGVATVGAAVDLAKINAAAQEKAQQQALGFAAQANSQLMSGLKAGYEDLLQNNRALTDSSLKAILQSQDLSFDFADDITRADHELVQGTLDRFMQNTRDQTAKTFDTVSQFANDLYTANQTENERSFDRISKLATVAVVVLAVAIVFSKRV